MTELPQIPINVDLNWLTLLGTILLPALVAFVVKRAASSAWKAGTLAVLAVLLGVVNEATKAITAGDAYVFDANVAIPTIVSAFAGAALLHLGLLSPTGLTGSNGSIQAVAPGGIGPAEAPSAQL